MYSVVHPRLVEMYNTDCMVSLNCQEMSKKKAHKYLLGMLVVKRCEFVWRRCQLSAHKSLAAAKDHVFM